MNLLSKIDILSKNIVIKQIFNMLFYLSTSLFFITLIYNHIKLIINPWQLHFTEGAVLFITKMINTGNNPYSLENLPLGTYVYGIVYPYIVSIFTNIFGESLTIHRTITALSIFGSCFLIWIVLSKGKVSFKLRILGILSIYVVSLVSLIPTAQPDATGTFFLLLTVVIPHIRNYSIKSLILSTIMGLLSFYTKPYFIIGPFYITVVLFFFKSKKDSILYILFFISSLFISVFYIDKFFDSYFTNTFAINVNFANLSYRYAFHQLKLFFELSPFGLIFFILYMFIFVKEYKRSFKFYDLLKSIKNNHFSILHLYTLFSFLIIIFILGRHKNNYMCYLYELIMPFYVISGVYISSKLIKKNNNIFTKLFIYGILTISIVMPTLYFNIIPIRKQPCVYNGTWKHIDNIIKNNNMIMGSPPVVASLIKRNKRIYDTGHSECFWRGRINSSSITQKLFLKNNIINNSWEKYHNDILNKINNEEFNVLLLNDRAKFPIISDSVLIGHYKKTETLTVCMQQTQPWKIIVYKPIHNNL